jgi:hypothetical protein
MKYADCVVRITFDAFCFIVESNFNLPKNKVLPFAYVLEM